MIDEITLDPQLKYWMLLPITVAMVLVGLLRSNVTYLITPRPKLDPVKNAREKSFLKRALAFRQNYNVLSASEFEARKTYFIEKLKSDEFLAKKQGTEEISNPLADASMNDAMMNMGKGNLMNFVPQTLIMAWVNYFFAGSVVMKLPFPLTEGFKSMLQNGVNTPDLSVRYVSAISWYFVNLLGLRPVYALLMNDPASAQELVNQQQQQFNFGGPGGPKPHQVFQAESESIQILEHESVFSGVVERVLNSY
ncbi:hypothetical protein ACI3LY_004736 [Candidozyma auris]|uniref:ER membrane protein complex subunit 3 n=2 Tax=Candidozyma auris TaxID=498019 RepID=A0A2H0ZF09_CANAR|nr:hypothetical protein B9J08_005467 [[Candida] auris]QWW24497.1 hypothetical protein CA7LBN_003354 [[Candida] auris]